ncbi:MAG: hypothetical protein MK085_06260 [Phycisphaerales bacterium]|nr:hypothetical protein [Phycisphaerales bacterium]
MTAELPGHTPDQRKGSPLPLVLGWFILLLAGCCAAGWAAATQPEASWSSPVLAAAIAGAVLVLAIAPLTLTLMRRGAVDANPRELHRLAEGIHEHTMLSDASKRLVFRDRELDMLRMLIEEDIAAGEFDAAIRLLEELSAGFGRLEESEAYRTRIETARHADVEARIAKGLEDVNRRVAKGDWNQAILVARRLQRLFPDAPALTDLETHVGAARRRHAAGLAQTLDAARAEDRMDDAMQALKELDRHVDADEASRLAPVAQDVISRHREHLGERFKAACEARDWPEALKLGEQITSQYPNARMAEEIESMLEGLRQRADHRD